MDVGDRRITNVEDPVVVALAVRADDHETRMRALEKFRWMATGALAFVGFAFPTTVAAVVAVLTAR